MYLIDILFKRLKIIVFMLSVQLLCVFIYIKKSIIYMLI